MRIGHLQKQNTLTLKDTIEFPPERDGLLYINWKAPWNYKVQNINQYHLEFNGVQSDLIL